MSELIFTPKLASATTISPAGAAAGSAGNLAGECPQVRLIWKATTAGNLCQIRWGTGAQTAVTTDMAMADGATEVFTKQLADTLSVIGTGTLYVVCGVGE